MLCHDLGSNFIPRGYLDRQATCVCAVHSLLRTPAFNLTEVIRKWRQVNGCKRENLEKNLVIRCQNIPLFGYL